MDAFQYRANQFLCEAVPVKTIAERFGTPTYAYSRAAILENFRAVNRGLEAIPSLVCYSVKANSNLRILRLLREAGAGFDIVSGGELARVLRAGADPQRVVFSGVGKTQQEVDAGLAAGILAFNVESAGELELIEARARALDKRAGVSVRVNPDVVAETHRRHRRQLLVRESPGNETATRGRRAKHRHGKKHAKKHKKISRVYKTL